MRDQFGLVFAVLGALIGITLVVAIAEDSWKTRHPCVREQMVCGPRWVFGGRSPVYINDCRMECMERKP